MNERNPIHIGTSGWHYDHWRGPFYPVDLRPERFLAYYQDRFHTVEINNSFYRLPERETLLAWRRAVAADFLFSVKGSRYITHMKKLKDPEEPVSTFMGRLEALGDKLGPILFQLPPHWECNPGRLKDFLDALPRSHRYAFEFRDVSWIRDETLSILQDHGAAFCIYEFAGMRSPRHVTADFVYIRLHGPAGSAYRGSYDAEALAGWAAAFADWARQGKEIYCYFDNDEAGYAALDALRLQTMTARG